MSLESVREWRLCRSTYVIPLFITAAYLRASLESVCLHKLACILQALVEHIIIGGGSVSYSASSGQNSEMGWAAYGEDCSTEMTLTSGATPVKTRVLTS